MGRRRRKLSAEEQDKAAREELERAKSAISYRKEQLAEAIEELRSLQGVGGWLAAIVGKRARYEAELNAKISTLQTQLVTDRKALIEARQSVAKFDDKARVAQAEAERRTAELEVLAERIRGRSSHPIHHELAQIDSEIEMFESMLEDVTEAWFATARLTEAINLVLRSCGRAKFWATVDAISYFGSSNSFASTLETRSNARAIPQAVSEFNAACARIGLAPLSIEVPDLGLGWDQLLLDHRLADFRQLDRVERFAAVAETERDTVRETMLFISQRRAEILASIDEKSKARRSLLGGAL